MRRGLAGLMLVAVVLAVGSPAGAKGTGPSRSRLEAAARHVVGSTGAPGAIVAISVHGRRPTVVTAGVDSRSGAPIDPTQPFYVASVTKSFTAAIVLDLVRRRKLKLDDAVSKYVPGWPNGRRITIRMLLNHSSGFTSWGNRNDPDDSQWSALVDPNLSRVLTVDESLAPTFRARKLLFRPGHGTNYSNANAQLAGLVAEKASGRSYGELVSALTKRLHLTGTALSYERPPGARPIMAGVFRLDPPGIDLDVSTVPQTAVQSFLGPAAGMVSTVHDLMAWAERDLRDGSFPTRALNREARRIDAGGAGLGLLGFGRHGYCIFDGCPKRERFTGVGFAGNGQGMAVRVVHDPRRDVTVLVFANSSKDVKLDPEVARILKLFPTD